MKETLRHQQAFEYYYSLGLERSLNKVAKQFGVSAPTVSNWARDYNWNNRVHERDNKNMATIREETDKQIVQQMEGYRKLIQASVADYIKRLKSGNVKIETVSDFARLVRLDMELCGFVNDTYFKRDEEDTKISAETTNTLAEIESGLRELGDKSA